ncbi:hypothetical protein RIF29_38907 [Crotalaria pallida]|uniref:Uncharacterized protein n=1 Tax=Crotalaria pallida TaxID=3830 RepID=A0AAN9E0P4_CROPI
MAEQIPYGVVVSIINRLASLAFREFGRIYGVFGELEKLKNTLELIQAELSDAEERQDDDRAVKIWIRRLKQVLHDADDLFDELVIEDLRDKVINANSHSKVSGLLSSSKYSIAFRRKVSHEVENITQQLNDVCKDMSMLKLKQRTIVFKENESAWRETSSYVLQSDIVGREGSKKEIVDLLEETNTNQNVSLIAIVGIGGLGKTALAQLAYNDAQVQNHFQKKMWVCVSDDFEVKTILRKMLESLHDNEVGNLALDILQKKVRKELNGKRYMLVLDDVWNENHLKWNDLRAYLMCGGQGSKILVTTRNTSVTETMGLSTPYVLQGLSKEESWVLLKNLAFSARRISPNLVSIGERIATKCRGVPLAIRTMGGLLQSKNEESEWLDILDGDFWRLCEERDSIMPVLKLSYQNLPLGLRQCFSYCCLYPKNWEIKTDELIQLWIAQGYLECSTETQSMEDVGNQYAKMLLMRSFFQEASVSEYHNVTSFKMHDLMHDLAISVAGNDCFLDSEGKGIVGRPMHISFGCKTICSFDSLHSSKLRTIRCKIKGQFLSKSSVIKKLKFLRALDLSSSDLVELPESFDQLKHLRYLDLSNCKKLICLPKSLVNLVSLQTLKLCGCDKLVLSFEIITKLISLRHLEIEKYKAFENMMPVGLGKLTSLRYLPEFVVDFSAKNEGGKLNELKSLDNIRGCLRISNLSLVKDVASESQEANLKAKKYIRRLELCWGQQGYVYKNINSDSLQLLDNLCPHQNLRELSVGWYPGLRFSSWLSSVTSIVEISLYGLFGCQTLPPLERLPWLKRLEICGMDELHYIHYEEVSHVPFPSLERLIVVDSPNLRGWQRFADVNQATDIDKHLLQSSFPCLSYLEIIGCPNLTCMPTYPHLAEKLMLQSCNVKPMIETCLVQLQSSSFHPFSTLELLQIGDVDMEAMPEEWMRNLASLKRFSISRSPSIAPVFQYLQYLPVGLEDLEICDVDKLDIWKDEDNVSTWHAPPGLCSLKRISIKSCKSLKALPEWIYNLQSVNCILIGDCPALESLPEDIRCFTNLQTLQIRLCPILSDRCKEGTGVDWPNIAHIPNISMDRNLNW